MGTLEATAALIDRLSRCIEDAIAGAGLPAPSRPDRDSRAPAAA